MPEIDLEETLEKLAKDYSGKLSPELIFVEIGTSKGISALRILKGIKESGIQRWFFTIDPYGDKPYRQGEETLYETIYGEETFRKTMFELNKYAYQNNLLYCHWRMLDSDFMRYFPEMEFWHKSQKIKNAQFGFVYLDGEHTKEIVLKEFEWFYSRMPKGGIIIIDDVRFLGMENGIEDLFKNFKGNWSFQIYEYNDRGYFIKNE